jgi:hypothetical protein
VRQSKSKKTGESMNMAKKKMLLAASVAGILAVTGMVSSGAVYAEEGVPCAGINACKGQGACGGKGHGCAGNNSCKGQGWVSTASEAECKEKGGTVTTTGM